MAILDADLQSTVEEWLVELEAHTFVQSEFIKALIARTPADPTGDAPLMEAIRTVNRHISALPADKREAYAAALKLIDPLPYRDGALHSP